MSLNNRPITSSSSDFHRLFQAWQVTGSDTWDSLPAHLSSPTVAMPTGGVTDVCVCVCVCRLCQHLVILAQHSFLSFLLLSDQRPHTKAAQSTRVQYQCILNCATMPALIYYFLLFFLIDASYYHVIPFSSPLVYFRFNFHFFSCYMAVFVLWLGLDRKTTWLASG